MGGGWELGLKDGIRMGFQASLLTSDRYGNTVQVERDSNNNVSEIISPNGSWTVDPRRPMPKPSRSQHQEDGQRKPTLCA